MLEQEGIAQERLAQERLEQERLAAYAAGLLLRIHCTH
jgi:hypothetical protein